MYLKRCEINNFRSIRKLNIPFDTKFQILVGLNESGKSNILKALAFMAPETVPNADDIRDPRHNENPVTAAYIRFVFGLDKKETKQIYNKVKPLFQAKKYTHSLIQIGTKNYSLPDFCDYKKEGLYHIDLLKKEKSSRHWRLLGSHYNVSKTWKKVPSAWERYPDFEENAFKYICVEDYPEYKDLNELQDITIDELNSDVGAEVVNLVNQNLFKCLNWKYSESNLLPGRIDIESFKVTPDICKPLRNIFYLSGNVNIQKTISDAQAKTNGMKNLLRRLSDITTRHLRKVWPEYNRLSISLTQNGSVVEAGIEDEYNVYSLDRRSDGFKRFITFLLLISAEARADYLYDSLIVIDEPDIGLHPSGIRYLREELQKVAKDNLVLIASHSIFMIDKDRIDRHIIVKKEKEESTIISDHSSEMLDEEVIYRALGYSLFELLKKKNIIFEGWTDKYTFERWINSRRSNKTVKDWWKNMGMVYALGAKDVQRVAANLESFDREYLIVSDSDKPSVEYKQKFKGKHKWLTYADLEFAEKETIEDFLNETYVIDIIQNILKKEQLDKNFEIPSDTTFNKKLMLITKGLKLDQQESARLKKIIKNSIFDDLDVKHIELEQLQKAIQKNI